MAVPTRPVQNAIVDPVWGQWVHDELAGFRVWAGRVAKVTDAYGDFSLAKPAGMGTVLAAIASPFYDANLIVLHRNADLNWKARFSSNTVATNYGLTVDFIIVGTAA